MRNACARVGGLLALGCSAVPATAGVFTIGDSDRGWFAERGYHSETNHNTFTGQETSTLFGNAPSDTDRYNSFFVFDLSSIAGEVTSVGVNFGSVRTITPTGQQNFDFRVYDVTSSIADLSVSHSVGSASGLSVFEDLQSGDSYGDFTLTKWYSGQAFGFELSWAGLDAVKNAGNGLFAFGVSWASPFLTPGGPEGVTFATSSATQSGAELVVGTDGSSIAGYLATPVPQPMAIALAAPALAGVTLRRRTRRQA